MDIPAPKNALNKTNTSQDIADGAASAAPDGNQPSSPEAQAEERSKRVAELIKSKEYGFIIKEKRTKPLLVFSLGAKKHRKKSASVRGSKSKHGHQPATPHAKSKE